MVNGGDAQVKPAGTEAQLIIEVLVLRLSVSRV
jgi:hypothetical protein